MKMFCAGLLGVVLTFGVVAAQAGALNFDYSLSGGGETISGEITGLTNNAASTPSHFTITAAGPTALSEGLPLDLATLVTSNADTLTVSNGAITGFDYVGTSNQVFFDFFTGFDHFAQFNDSSVSIIQSDQNTSDPLSAIGFTSSPAVAVPEPASLAILISAIGGIILVRRRVFGRAAA